MSKFGGVYSGMTIGAFFALMELFHISDGADILNQDISHERVFIDDEVITDGREKVRDVVMGHIFDKEDHMQLLDIQRRNAQQKLDQIDSVCAFIEYVQTTREHDIDSELVTSLEDWR